MASLIELESKLNHIDIELHTVIEEIRASKSKLVTLEELVEKISQYKVDDIDTTKLIRKMRDRND